MTTVCTYRCITHILTVQILTFENNSLSTDGDNSKRFFPDVDPDGFLIENVNLILLIFD